MVLLMVLLINGYWEKLKTLGAEVFPIKYVRVGGQFQYLSQDKIKGLLQPMVNTGFFAVDLQGVQMQVASLPWADRAEVKRVWPDTIEIRAYEQQPVARWQEHKLFNKRGELFAPENVDAFASLPVIKGSDEQATQLFKVMREIKERLKANGLTLTKFEATERQSWQLTLDNGINMQLGRQQPMQKLKRFLNVLPVLGYTKLELIKAVDMRYPNGFSIMWKQQAPTEWEHNSLDGKVYG